MNPLPSYPAGAPTTAGIESAFAEFPEWFTLRGHSGVYRIDRIRSCSEGVIVLANVNGREVSRCSLPELCENIYEEA